MIVLAAAAIAAMLTGCIAGPAISFLIPDGDSAPTFENEDIRLEVENENLDVFLKITNLRATRR